MKPILLLLGSALTSMLVGCSTLGGDNIKPSVYHLEKPFTHGDLVISGWESPPIRNGKLVPQAKLLVADSLNSGPAFVRLSRGHAYHGLTLSQVDARGDTIGDPAKGLAGVITEDISLELEPPSPKRYLILRDISGYHVAFYSDVPHPALR